MFTPPPCRTKQAIVGFLILATLIGAVLFIVDIVDGEVSSMGIWGGVIAVMCAVCAGVASQVENEYFGCE
jgi:hypothetical protein